MIKLFISVFTMTFIVLCFSFILINRHYQKRISSNEVQDLIIDIREKNIKTRKAFVEAAKDGKITRYEQLEIRRILEDEDYELLVERAARSKFTVKEIYGEVIGK